MQIEVQDAGKKGSTGKEEEQVASYEFGGRCPPLHRQAPGKL
jgi:hypothetical protein